MVPRIYRLRSPLLLTLAIAGAAQAGWSGTQYTCANGCVANNTVGGTMVATRDDAQCCEMSCCPGVMQVLSAPGTWYENEVNRALCCLPTTGWCTWYSTYADTPFSIQCIDTMTSIVTTYYTSGTSYCPDLEQPALLPTMPTCSLTTTTTAPSTVTTTEPTTMMAGWGGQGLCAPFLASNGQVYENRCVQFDTGAVCNDDGVAASCTCSSGYTDATCGVTTAQLGQMAPLAGPTATADSVLGTMKGLKGGGTAVFSSGMPAFLSFLTDDERVTLSYNVEDLITDATFEGKQLDLNTAFISFNDPSLGNCFTFNHWNSSFHYKARMIGQKGGLVVELDVMPEEYLPFIDMMGLNIFVTQVGADIYVESSKIISQPGGFDKLLLKRTTTQLLDGCAADKSAAQSYYFNGNYSVDGCYRSCYQDACFSACGCMDPMYQRKEGVASCTFDQLPCIFAMAAQRKDPDTWPECHCPEPCYSQDYSVAYSRAAISSKVVCQKAGFYNVTQGCAPRRSFVTVGFASLEALVQVEVERYPLSRALGNIGNVGGLLLGFSMICFFEALFFLVAMGFFGAHKEQHAPTPGRPKKDF